MPRRTSLPIPTAYQWVAFVRWGVVALLATAVSYAAAQQQQTVQPPGGYNSSMPAHPDKPYLLPEANHPPDANDQMVMDQQLTKKQKFEAANAIERSRSPTMRPSCSSLQPNSRSPWTRPTKIPSRSMSFARRTPLSGWPKV